MLTHSVTSSENGDEPASMVYKIFIKFIKFLYYVTECVTN